MMDDKLSDVLRDAKKLRIFFSRMVPLTTFLSGWRPGSPLVCPFHNDSNPSAKLFKDPDGVERLQCFTEHRQYTSYDYVKTVLKQDPLSYLLKNFSQAQMENGLKSVIFTISNRPVAVDLDEASEKLPDIAAFLSAVYFEHRKISNGT